MAVRQIHVELLASAYEGEELMMGNWVSSKVRLRATREFQIVNVARQGTLLSGHVDYSRVNLGSGRPTRMPTEFTERYQVTRRASWSRR